MRPLISADAAPFRDAEAPSRAPLACGALGRYDRGRVAEMAAKLDDRMRVVHEDRDSILMLDREPLTWSGRRERGLGWIEGGEWRGGVASRPIRKFAQAASLSSGSRSATLANTPSRSERVNVHSNGRAISA